VALSTSLLRALSTRHAQPCPSQASTNPNSHPSPPLHPYPVLGDPLCSCKANGVSESTHTDTHNTHTITHTHLPALGRCGSRLQHVCPGTAPLHHPASLLHPRAPPRLAACTPGTCTGHNTCTSTGRSTPTSPARDHAIEKQPRDAECSSTERVGSRSRVECAVRYRRPLVDHPLSDVCAQALAWGSIPCEETVPYAVRETYQPVARVVPCPSPPLALAHAEREDHHEPKAAHPQALQRAAHNTQHTTHNTQHSGGTSTA
jgi:hypothetical protein